ncbi:hypothetical protein [Streptomyces sp. NPDC001450]
MTDCSAASWATRAMRRSRATEEDSSLTPAYSASAGRGTSSRACRPTASINSSSPLPPPCRSRYAFCRQAAEQ